jgi:hypothetical protein
MEIINMYTNGGYLQNNPEWGAEDAGQKAQWVKNLIERNKISFSEAVEVGTGTGALLKELSLQHPAVTLWQGYDIAPDAIEMAKKKETDKLRFFNEDFLKTMGNTECLLLIDVVEHIPDYYHFLQQLKNRSIYFVFHIPLDISCRTLLKPHIMYQQRQSVGHIHYFSKEMVWWMLQDTGYTIIDWFYTKPMLDILPQASLKNKTKKILRNTFFPLQKDVMAKLLGGYSVMILAK